MFGYFGHRLYIDSPSVLILRHISPMVDVLSGHGWKRGQPHLVRLTENQAKVLNDRQWTVGYNRLSHSEKAALTAIAGLNRAVKTRYVKARARLELERLALLHGPSGAPNE